MVVTITNIETGKSVEANYAIECLVDNAEFIIEARVEESGTVFDYSDFRLGEALGIITMFKYMVRNWNISINTDTARALGVAFTVVADSCEYLMDGDLQNTLGDIEEIRSIACMWGVIFEELGNKLIDISR